MSAAAAILDRVSSSNRTQLLPKTSDGFVMRRIGSMLSQAEEERRRAHAVFVLPFVALLLRLVRALSRCLVKLLEFPGKLRRLGAAV